jgi:hypothetical protein
LLEFNPARTAAQKAELLRAACTVNGFQCLKIGTIKDNKTLGRR